jgi:hypothetical protein
MSGDGLKSRGAAGITGSAMRPSTRRTGAVVILLLVVGVLVGGVHAAPHGHDGAGLYDPDCPLAALAAVARGAGQVAAAAVAPLVPASVLVALPLGLAVTLVQAAHTRLRGPPAR